MKLKNKVACITGSARGLGFAISEALAKEGATIIINELHKEAVDQAVNTLKEKGIQAYGFVANVSKKTEVEMMIEKIVEINGKIDILVNNAGGELRTPKNIEDIREEHWDQVLDVNLKGTFFCSQVSFKYMKSQKKGKIINISSIGGRTASIVTGVAYAAAKGGVISFTRRLAKEVGEHNICVNAVAPGLIISGDRLRETWNKMSDEQQNSVLADIPLRGLGKAEDPAKVVAFLASDEYDLPKLCAFNFVLEGTRPGGVAAALDIDPHGKSFSWALLQIEISIDKGLPIEKQV